MNGPGCSEADPWVLNSSKRNPEMLPYGKKVEA